MEIWQMDAIAQRDMVRSGHISAVALMEITLDRIARLNPTYNAVISMMDHDAALEQARLADQATDKSGALHGLPLAVKDLANAQGLWTSMGSPLFLQKPAPKDDLFVARMRAAGAVIFAKTNTPEFGLGSHTFNPVHGVTGNAYDPSKSAGGSSGGAAVALAQRMVALADGSDMMGSLRNPAGWNNIYGMRPTWGLVPNEPLGDTFIQQLASNGPMARSPRDLALLLGVQAGPDPRQPFGRASQDFLADMAGYDLKSARIGYLGSWGLPLDYGIDIVTESAIKDMSDLGAQVDYIDAPFDMDQIWQAWVTLRHWAVAGTLAPFYQNDATCDKLKASAKWEIENGLRLTALDVHRASVIRSQWYAKAAELFETYDALVLPSAQVWPFDKTIEHPTQVGGVDMDTYHRWMQVVIPAGLLGLPVVNMPVGFCGMGLPAGIQLIGAKGADTKLLGLAQSWHSAFAHSSKEPNAI